MNLAKRILDEANEDISKTNFYKVIQNNIPIVIDGLNKLSGEFKDAHSDTEVQDYDNLGKTLKALTEICEELDKNGFTYFPQPTDFRKQLLHDIFNNFADFYSSYTDGFSEEDIEILNTNSKDLLNIIDKLYK